MIKNRCNGCNYEGKDCALILKRCIKDYPELEKEEW